MRPRLAHLRFARLPALVCALALLAASPAAAQPAASAPSATQPVPPAPPRPAASAAPAAPAKPAPPATVVVAPDSPRASVQRFLDLCRAGEYAEAAAFLDIPEQRKAEGAQLARRLKAVLDRQIWVKADDISPLPFGDASDRLPAGVEEIGKVPGPLGFEPVRLVRHHTPDGGRWRFSRATVEHVDAWFGRLRDRWIEEHVPEVLLRTGPRSLAWWQWIALPLLFASGLGVGHVLGYVTRLGLKRLLSRGTHAWDDALVARLGAPITLAWALGGVWLALPPLALYPPAQQLVGQVIRAGFLLTVFWFVTRAIEVAGRRLVEVQKDNAAARSVVPLGVRALEFAVLAVGVIAALSALGFEVGSLIAGLGIGGIALALAAQKTGENLFGSLSIGVDQPFRVGDYITVDTVSGTVESIGLRSTRIRTPDRTLVTMPNGKLADMRIESFTQRDRIKFACTLTLERGTSPAVVRAVLEQARGLLNDHPNLWAESTVALAAIGHSSLDIEVVAWVTTTSWNDYLPLRGELLLQLLELVERAGAKLAYPTRTVEVRTPAT